MSITKNRKRVKGYQHEYEPPNLTEDEKLHIKNLTDARVCNREVERVARNIATAMANPQTPKIVRAHIKAYIDDLFQLDITETPEAILCLYPIVCRKISQIPFVPDRERIEALTSNSRKQAIAESKEESDCKPRTSITIGTAVDLAEELLDTERDDPEERAITLIALIEGVGLETYPFLRKRIVDEIFHLAYGHAVRWSDAEETFINRAIKMSRKGCK